MQDTWVQSLDQEDPLEKGMATHSSILAWSIPWTEEPGGLQSMGSQRVGQTQRLTLSLSHPTKQRVLFCDTCMSLVFVCDDKEYSSYSELWFLKKGKLLL